MSSEEPKPKAAPAAGDAAQAGASTTANDVEGNFIKVSGNSNPKAVAGKIAHTTREQGEPPGILCIGAASINQAVKSICIARQYLEKDGVDLTFQPAFRDKDRRASVALYITKLASRAPLVVGDAEVVELPVSSHSKPAVVAGALAARIREGKQCSLVSIGVDAVANAVLTIGNSRLYLEQDSKDVRAQTEFVTVHKEDRDLNAVKFSIKVDAL